MEKLSGKIAVLHQNIGSKSEGNFAYLQTEDTTYTLFREGFREINDSFFSEYMGDNVIVEGEILNNNWLMVDNIEVAAEEFTEENNAEKEIEEHNENM